jgi:hypothetical protein
MARAQGNSIAYTFMLLDRQALAWREKVRNRRGELLRRTRALARAFAAAE